MKKAALNLLYVLLFFGALLFFTPKESLYYAAEEQLRSMGVIISDEEAVDHGFSLEIRDARLYVQKIKSADIGSATVAIFGFYNTLSAEKVLLDQTFEKFFPPVIEHIDLHQSILDPIHLKATANGDFGEAEASIDLLERSAALIVKPSKLMLSRYKSTLANLKKTEEGEYRYDYQF